MVDMQKDDYIFNLAQHNLDDDYVLEQLQKYGNSTNVNYVQYHLNVFSLAVLKNRYSIVKYLLDKCAQNPNYIDLNFTNMFGMSTFMQAVAKQNKKMIKVLVDFQLQHQAFDLTLCNQFGQNIFHLLFEYINQNTLSCFKNIVKIKNLNINRRDDNQNTPFEVLVYSEKGETHERIKVLEYLIKKNQSINNQHNIDFNSIGPGKLNAFLYAVLKDDDHSMVKIFLENSHLFDIKNTQLQHALVVAMNCENKTRFDLMLKQSIFHDISFLNEALEKIKSPTEFNKIQKIIIQLEKKQMESALDNKDTQVLNKKTTQKI